MEPNQDPGAGGKIILEWIFRKWDGGTCTGLIWLRIGKGGGCTSKGSNNTSGFIKCEEFLD
jgi:hypothetical protein